MKAQKVVLVTLLSVIFGLSSQAQKTRPCDEGLLFQFKKINPAEHTKMQREVPTKCHTFYAPRGMTHIDTVVCQNWDTVANVWVNDSRTILTYNSNEQLTEEIEYTWNGASWDNDNRYTYTYDANNNLTERIDYTWNGASWDNDYRYTDTYDVNNNVTEEIGYAWNGTGWDNDWRDTYTYDANNNQTEWIVYIWNGTGWDNDIRFTSIYDANNNKTEQISYYWNGTSSAWDNSNRDTYTYNADNKVTEEIQYYWNGTSWENNGRNTYTYDGNNNVTQEISYNWNSANSTWENNWKGDYTYTGGNVGGIGYAWTGSTWRYDVKCNWTFNPFVGVSDAIKDTDISVSVYPNPFSASATIVIRLGGSQPFTFVMYDLLGREIKNETIRNSDTFVIRRGNLPNGMYFYEVKSEKKIIGKGKVVIQ